MALPTLHARGPSRSQVLATRMARRREQETRSRQQWDQNARYFREQDVCSQRQTAWSSSLYFQRSMSSYHSQRMKQEKQADLERRRMLLRVMLRNEQDQLEAELAELTPDSGSLASQLVKKTEELRTLRAERRKKLAQELLKEHWKKNNPDLREVESALHKDHVVSQWQEQIAEKKQQEEARQEEKRRFENEYERTRKEALERMREEEEKRKAEERKRGEALLKQMEELKLREEEAKLLKEEQEVLQAQQWELENIEVERRQAEERRKKSEMGGFLIRQYRAQLKRKAQRVQEELEADHKILAALMEGEAADMRLETERRERAMVDAATMKKVIEEQLQLEHEREAELDFIRREQAQRVWEKREAEWEKERKARERLMHDVLVGRQQQLEQKMQENHEAQEEALTRREELIRFLEQENEDIQREKAEEEDRKTGRIQELNAQVEQQHQDEWEEQLQIEQEEERKREALRIQDEELRQEMEMMNRRGYQEKIHSRPRSAWT